MHLEAETPFGLVIVYVTSKKVFTHFAQLWQGGLKMNFFFLAKHEMFVYFIYFFPERGQSSLFFIDLFMIWNIGVTSISSFDELTHIALFDIFSKVKNEFFDC